MDKRRRSRAWRDRNTQFNVAADRIARLPLQTAAPGDSVDLERGEAVALLQARNNFAADDELIKTGDRMEQALLDTIGYKATLQRARVAREVEHQRRENPEHQRAERRGPQRGADARAQRLQR